MFHLSFDDSGFRKLKQKLQSYRGSPLDPHHREYVRNLGLIGMGDALLTGRTRRAGG